MPKFVDDVVRDIKWRFRNVNWDDVKDQAVVFASIFAGNLVCFGLGHFFGICRGYTAGYSEGQRTVIEAIKALSK